MGLGGAGKSKILRSILGLETFRQELTQHIEAEVFFLQGKFSFAFRPFYSLDGDCPLLKSPDVRY